MRVSYLGTTMLLFDDGKDALLFDCHVTRPSMLRCMLGKMETDKEVADKVLSDFDFSRLRGIFISHSHHDHVMDMPYFAGRLGTNVYGSPSALQVARGGGIKEEKLFSYEKQKEYVIGEGRIQVLPSIHSVAHWYNNDLGQTIDAPLTMPARKKAFKEGGSFDFLISHQGKRYLLRPSYNFIPGQLDDVQADVLFLGIGGLGKDSPDRREMFFAQTLDKVRPSLVIPIHWDHFFLPLYGPVKGLEGFMDHTGLGLRLVAEHCQKRGISFIIQPPLSTMEV